MVREQPRLLRRVDQTGVPLLAARLILGGTMIYMGWVKASDPVEFLKLIREYQMVPEGAYLMMNLLAVALPWVEILGGLLLIAGLALRGTAILFLVMLLGFTGVVAARALGIYQAGAPSFCGIKFDCGCGAGEVLICNKLLENAALIGLSLVVLLSGSRRFCLRGELVPGNPSSPDRVSAGLPADAQG